MDQTARAFPSLTRIELAREGDFTLGALRIRPSRREVEAAGARHVLQRRVMQVLVALAHPTDEVVSHDELIRRCWGGLAVGEDAIGRCIGQLRRFAAQWAEPPFEIATIAGVGYRLDAAAGADSGIDGTLLASSRRAWRGRRAWMAAGACALVLLAAGAGWVATHSGSANPPPPSRVAVLPLETLSAGQNVRYLADSISDEMLSVLSANQVEALSRAAAGLQSGASGQEAAKLGIGFLLNGSVQDDGKETRVSIRLDDAPTHVTLWSADFRRDSASAADLRIEVAAKVADIIEIAQFARTNPPTLKDDAALSALLEAHDLVRWDRSRSWARLLELAQRVVTSAPDFAFGHSMLALANTYAIRWRAMPEQDPAMVAVARREAARALAIDPRDSSAYFALSLLEKHYREREAVLLKGLAVDGHPAAPFAALNNTEGEVLLSVGRLRDALPFIQRSVALDPLSALKSESLIRSYAVVGQTSEAQDLLNQSLARWPNHPEIRTIRLYLQTFYGGADDALALLKDRAALPADLTPKAIAAWRDFLDAEHARDPALSARVASSVVNAADAGALNHRTAVLMLSSLGDVDHAFDQAAQALSRPDANPDFLFSQPAAAMRRDPRFMNLAGRFGLLDYWRGTGKWPDFCAGPHPEIDCRAAAAKAGV